MFPLVVLIFWHKHRWDIVEVEVLIQCDNEKQFDTNSTSFFKIVDYFTILITIVKLTPEINALHEIYMYVYLHIFYTVIIRVL